MLVAFDIHAHRADHHVLAKLHSVDADDQQVHLVERRPNKASTSDSEAWIIWRLTLDFDTPHRVGHLRIYDLIRP